MLLHIHNVPLRTKLYENKSVRSRIELTDQKKSINILVKMIEDFNAHLLTWQGNQFPKYNSDSTRRKKLYDKAVKHNCLLGMFKDYEWISMMMEKED